MALIRSEALFTALKAQRHAPYMHFPESRRSALGDVLRVFDLRPRDALTLAVDAQPQYVSVLDGIVRVRQRAGDPIELRRGQSRLVDWREPSIVLESPGGAVACVADSEGLDELISFESLVAGMDAGERLSMEALERARRSPALGRVPLECVEEAFRRMGSRQVAAGTDVIRQGEEGDLFYVIAQGRAEVWQTGLYDDAPRKVAELGSGEVFGDEALVSGGTRSATVRVVADAILLTLTKDDYTQLISRQLVEGVEPAVARTMLEAGYRLLDVRYAEEHEDSRIAPCELLPLPDLRAGAGRLDKGARWVVYCRSGKRSAVATLLLKQRGFQAVSLRGGINAWPYAVENGGLAA